MLYVTTNGSPCQQYGRRIKIFYKSQVNDVYRSYAFRQRFFSAVAGKEQALTLFAAEGFKHLENPAGTLVVKLSQSLVEYQRRKLGLEQKLKQRQSEGKIRRIPCSCAEIVELCATVSALCRYGYATVFDTQRIVFSVGEV